MNIKPIAAAAALAVSLHAMPALADIYRCVLSDGSTSYSDSQCPSTSALVANITEELQVCTTTACKAGEDATHAEAIERLRQDKAALAQMQEMRLQKEAREVDQAQLRRLDLLEARLADERLSGGGGVYFPAYGGFAWDTAGRPGCRPHCGAKPPGGKAHSHRHPHFVPGVRIRF
jgi:hypothetical protein